MSPVAGLLHRCDWRSSKRRSRQEPCTRESDTGLSFDRHGCNVARMIERVFSPCHMNYMLLGNIVPHLHVHVVPRYPDDTAPERPLPWTPSEVSADEYAKQIEQLRKKLAPGRSSTSERRQAVFRYY